MYTPPVHRIEDLEVITALVKQFPFAILVSTGTNGIEVTHLPVLIEQQEPLILAAHMARANPHWHQFGSDSSSLFIIQGPHAYISPRNYVTRPNVPTWNYVAVHLSGRVEVIEDEEACLDHLRSMTLQMDPDISESHEESLEETFHQSKLKGLVVFRMRVERIEAKAKLSQNKSEPDRLAVKDALCDSQDPQERCMSQMMDGIRETTN